MHNIGSKQAASNSGKPSTTVTSSRKTNSPAKTFNSLPSNVKENGDCSTSSFSNTNHKTSKEVSIAVEKDSDSDDGGNELMFNPQYGTAPIELKAEFIDSLQDKDWENALKLCKMILVYEPKNQTATEYLSVLVERIELDDEISDDESDEETSSGEEDDEDQSDDDCDEDDSDSEYESEDESDSDSQVVIDVSKKWTKLVIASLSF